MSFIVKFFLENCEYWEIQYGSGFYILEVDFFCYVYEVPNCISEGVSRENIDFGLEFGNNTRSHTLPKETKTNSKHIR